MNRGIEVAWPLINYNMWTKERNICHLQLKVEKALLSLLKTFFDLLPHPIQCRNSREIAGTSFQYCMSGRGRG